MNSHNLHLLDTSPPTQLSTEEEAVLIQAA